jgi:hypothetical protein
MTEKNKSPKPNHVLVAVVTTAGSYPAEGFHDVPNGQPLTVQLHKAAKELGITGTDGWVAMVGGREVDVSQSYKDAGLTGEIKISWGPRETGGGCLR